MYYVSTIQDDEKANIPFEIDTAAQLVEHFDKQPAVVLGRLSVLISSLNSLIWGKEFHSGETNTNTNTNKKTNKDINDIDTCMLRRNNVLQLNIGAASDDGHLRVWNLNVHEQPPITDGPGNTISSALVSTMTIPTSDDGNRHKRAGKAIFKTVRFGAATGEPTDRPAHYLLFGVQSRLNRGSSFLVVWRLSTTDGAMYEELSRIKIFGGTEDKVRTMALACCEPANLNTVTVAFGSAGGLVCAAHVNETTGWSTVVGQDTRHATIVSDICAIAMAGNTVNDVCVVTTSMDKGVVFHGVAGLVEKTTAV